MLEGDFATLQAEVEASLEEQLLVQEKVERIAEGIQRDDTETLRHQAYTPQLEHMLKRLNRLAQEDMHNIDSAKQRLQVRRACRVSVVPVYDLPLVLSAWGA